MKNFLSTVLESTRPLSKKLLFICFVAGYLTATIFYGSFGPQIHQFLNSIIVGF